jgi:DNA-binding PadR family transcriptional regulator
MAPLTPTTYALLGQLALRPWSVYDLIQNIRRTLHWFWPRAESVIYAEIKRLEVAGLARSRHEAGARGRPRAVYEITTAGREALAAWLADAPAGSALHSEPALRLHLAPYGTRDDLLRAIDRIATDAAELIRQALVIGTEFVDSRHQFQDQVHVRALLFDYLWTTGVSNYLWAQRSRRTVERWHSIDGDRRSRAAGVRRIAELLAEDPLVGSSGR